MILDINTHSLDKQNAWTHSNRFASRGLAAQRQATTVVLAQRTFRMLAVIVGVYALLWTPAFFSPRYLDTPLGLITAAPVLSIYLFDMLGVPGLLEGSGACGWGWCAPTAAGWAFAVAFWLLVAWFMALGIDATLARKGDALHHVSREDAEGQDSRT